MTDGRFVTYVMLVVFVFAVIFLVMTMGEGVENGTDPFTTPSTYNG